MRKVFISYSFSKRTDFRRLHKRLKSVLENKFNLEVYAFVFDFIDTVDDTTLMDESLKKIDESDYVIVELSNKSVGIGIEAGYAKAKNKPIIYLHKKGSDMKQAMNGISDIVITYEDIEDLTMQVSKLNLFQG